MKLLHNIRDIPELAKGNVYLNNERELLEKLNKIIKDGHTNLQILTDFDHTLTRHTKDDEETVETSFVMLRQCPSIPQHCKDEGNRLAAKYKPIENDPHIDLEEKKKHMEDWSKAGSTLLKGLIFPREELMNIAKNMVQWFRKGVPEMISWSAERGVPVLVFSAGLGESVVAALAAADFLRPNVKVVSNFLALSAEGRIEGIEGSVIHTYNKNEAAIKETEYYELVKRRSNVLLLGDNIGDAGMAEGMDHCDVVVKVGLLGSRAEANLPRYLAAFDVVLVHEPALDLVPALLARL